MQYIVKQIVLTDEQIDQVNAAYVNAAQQAMPDFYNRYMKATMFPKQEAVQAAYEAFDYETVAAVDANDLEEVFAIGNGMGDNTKLTKLAKMKSVSVGDIIVEEKTGKMFYVDTFGFQEVY
jgi:hypothetical protein